MKVSEQCRIAASKENQILGLIRRTIMYKEKQLIVLLYKAIVRPHLEYCIQAWRPYRKKDIDKLERIQRRATKIIPELRDLSYESHLLQCGLTTPETRRLRGDQIEVFKIVNGYEDVDRNMFFKLKEGSGTRGHKAANFSMLLVILSSKSLIYIKNNIGPNTDFWGTPLKTDFQFETSPSTTTRCLLSVSHCSIQLVMLSPIAWAFNLSSNRWCGILSKAFWKSK